MFLVERTTADPIFLHSPTGLVYVAMPAYIGDDDTLKLIGGRNGYAITATATTSSSTSTAPPSRTVPSAAMATLIKQITPHLIAETAMVAPARQGPDPSPRSPDPG